MTMRGSIWTLALGSMLVLAAVASRAQQPAAAKGKGKAPTAPPGILRIVRNGVCDPNPVAGVPQVQAPGLSGLMDLALHPRFSENQRIYFTYHKPAGASAAPGNNAGIITLARGRRDGTLRELQQRIRDVRQGPDGFPYLLTAENNGALMRVEPFTEKQ
jgi:glucose/arabinose dehydrogenase